MLAIIFWIVIILTSGVIEYHTNALVSIFITIGAAVGLALAVAAVPFFLQGLVWFAVSAGGLWMLRPLALKKFPIHRRGGDLSLPVRSSMTHLTGIVEQVVGDETHPGRVKIQGESWKAVTDWPSPIEIGSSIKVDRVYGTTLWVYPT
jgi:membrane protein implicated in regulation of membrane protease activity